MKFLLICLFVVFAARHGSCKVAEAVDTFEFGQNVGRVVYKASGSMNILQREKDVKVLIPTCMILKYVRVDVNPENSGPPAVDFNWYTNVVTLSYDHDPYFKTSYTITAKAVPDPRCLTRSGKHQLVRMPDSDDNINVIINS